MEYNGTDRKPARMRRFARVCFKMQSVKCNRSLETERDNYFSWFFSYARCQFDELFPATTNSMVAIGRGIKILQVLFVIQFRWGGRNGMFSRVSFTVSVRKLKKVCIDLTIMWLKKWEKLYLFSVCKWNFVFEGFFVWVCVRVCSVRVHDVSSINTFLPPWARRNVPPLRTERTIKN